MLQSLTAPSPASPPHRPLSVTAVICTRNRPDQIGCAVASILANDYPNFSLLVVDQSNNGLTRDALAGQIANRLLDYLPMPDRGLSRARNLAIAHACGDIIAFTDDDCYVAPDWITQIANTFARAPQTSLLFGAVHLPANYQHTDGFASSFYPSSRLTTARNPRLASLGIGANMSIHRKLPADIGCFDEVLGVGSQLVGGEDVDYALRATHAGHYVTVDPSPIVVHTGGVRPPEECSLLWYRDAYAGGAVAAKELKTRHGTNTITLYGCVLRQQHAAIQAVILGKRPTGLRRATISTRGWIDGFVTGIRWPVVRQSGTHVFRPLSPRGLPQLAISC
jgi:glycosyltransferase involved in cell wall biosynthesis